MLESRTNQNSPDLRNGQVVLPAQNPVKLYERISDALLFVGFLFLSAIAIIAVAIATPVVLVISVLAGLVEKNSPRSGWRPAQV